MKEVAQLLELKLGRLFGIKGHGGCWFVLTEDGMVEKYSDYSSSLLCNTYLVDLLTGKCKIEKNFLNDIETSYLENMLRSSKDDILWIKKSFRLKSDEYLVYKVKTMDGYETLKMPYFEQGKFYKNMEREEKYTLKELGLFETG